MKEEIKAEEASALKIIDESNWDEGRKMLIRKIITDAAWATNGSPDKISGIAETTFRLAYMDIARDKELDEIKSVVRSTSESVEKISKTLDTVIERLEKNDSITEEIRDTVNTKVEGNRTWWETTTDAMIKLGWKGVIWVTVPLLAIVAVTYRVEILNLLRDIF